jgi:hypothetical protein
MDAPARIASVLIDPDQRTFGRAESNERRRDVVKEGHADMGQVETEHLAAHASFKLAGSHGLAASMVLDTIRLLPTRERLFAENALPRHGRDLMSRRDL